MSSYSEAIGPCGIIFDFESNCYISNPIMSSEDGIEFIFNYFQQIKIKNQLFKIMRV